MPQGSSDTSGTARRKALGEFLRTARARISPLDVGLPAGVRRRTPGLRREELAQLCDISATWYTWIEQGRDISVSPAVWARLADILRLSRAERHYLFDLAETADPDAMRVAVDPLPEGLADCVHAIATPAYILDRCWNVMACNQAFVTLFRGWPRRSDTKTAHETAHAGPLALSAAVAENDGGQEAPLPNLLRYIFLDPVARDLVVDWEARASRVTAEFRADAGPHIDEPDVRSVLDALLQESQVFAYWWTRQAVVEREGGERRFRSRDGGSLLTYQQFTFRLSTRPDCKLVMLLPDALQAYAS
ncbi:helix-turn-helix transcriptional regulator [Paracandidimonas soli]|uniref:Helix-turn-helix protein n=1 Tax=Paracandidimonas soli TaxID=1917182 RepID=A0A4R3VH28_9BURK|nr:helix-turn-helix transcriptional regulator [Paracandidimonas soli]TCV03064.1 helix-turn-helix protein [Paracandidimonas soli]